MRAAGPRNNSYSWRTFKQDLAARSTFINLAEGGGALSEDVHRLTHASLGEAKDLYRRITQQWPRLCRAVRCIQIAPPPEVLQSVSQQAGENSVCAQNPEAEQVGKWPPVKQARTVEHGNRMRTKVLVLFLCLLANPLFRGVLRERVSAPSPLLACLTGRPSSSRLLPGSPRRHVRWAI